MTQTQEQTTEIQKQPIQTIKDELLGEGAITLFMDSLPSAVGSHALATAKRFAKMVYVVVSQSPQLQQCTPKSIVRAASQSASLDLDIDIRGLAYLVPYTNNKVTPPRMEAQFQIGYMGLMELAYRSDKVKAIGAHCIYESEKDSVKITRNNGQYTVEHPFSYTPPTGSIIAVYATAEVDGFGPQTIVLRIDQVERLRQKSKAPNSPAWKDHYEAMVKKTAIRQLAKFLPKSVTSELSKGAAIDEQEDFVDTVARTAAFIDADLGSEPVDAEFASDDETPKSLPDKEPEQAQEPPATTGKGKGGKKPTTKAEAQAPEIPKFKYVCRACGTQFDEPRIIQPGNTKRCPNKNCGSLQIQAAPTPEE